MYGAISEKGAGEEVLPKVPLKMVHSRKKKKNSQQQSNKKTGNECAAVKEMKAHQHYIQKGHNQWKPETSRGLIC